MKTISVAQTVIALVVSLALAVLFTWVNMTWVSGFFLLLAGVIAVNGLFRFITRKSRD